MNALFSEAPALSDQDKSLVAAYQETGRTLDDLPYTQDFNDLVSRVQKDFPDLDERQIFHRLTSLRKAGRLPRLGSGRTRVVRLDAFEEELIGDLAAQIVGTLGQRDRLPYTQEFDQVVSEFNARTNRELSPHDVWRLVARVAK